MPGNDLPVTPRPRSLRGAIRDHVVLLSGLLGLMWAVELVDLLPFTPFDRYGIRPRSAVGFIGIITAPFLHAGFGHLLVNSVPFLILGGLVLLGGVKTFWKVTVFVMLFGGLGVWLFAGAFTNHIGASGLVFGYLGFLLTRGFFETSWLWIMVACATLAGYGGLLVGVLPTWPEISWQGHLFGFLAGIGAARLIFPRKRPLPLG